MGTGKDTFLQGLAPGQGGTPASDSGSSGASHSPDLQLELERLRAERDAIAAELQEERAERLRAEERLRLLEREKLQQMRQGAASREKLASELEEARLRAMRAEAQEAAFQADARLTEIATRRRESAEARDPSPEMSDVDDAAEIAEGPPDDFEAPARGEDETRTGDPRRRRDLGATRVPSSLLGDARAGRPASRDAAGSSDPRPGRERGGAASGGTPRRPASGAEPGDRPGNRAERSGSHLLSRFNDQPFVEQPRAPRSGSGSGSADAGATRGAGPRERTDAGAANRSSPGGRSGSTRGTTADSPSRGKPGGASGATTGAAGAAKSSGGRPRMDRGQLEARLVAGAVIHTTERFRQFEPVAQTHIMVCDWLTQATTYSELQAKAEGKLPESSLLDVLVLFAERTFILLE